MTSNKLIESTIVQEDHPDWGPLEDMLGPQGHDEFEWRAEVQLAGGTRIQAYKHAVSGHYLHLSDDGDAYQFIGEDHYLAIDPEDALWMARGPFAHICGFGPARTRGPDGAVSKNTQSD
jgi:hypothetical protein